MEKLEPNREKNSFGCLADTLEEFQKTKNDGRGISCVQTIIMYLRRNEVDKTKAVCLNESDKLRSYPDIMEVLQKELVKENF